MGEEANSANRITVFGQRLIYGEQPQPLDACLCKQNSIERVFAQSRKVVDGNGVFAEMGSRGAVGL
jgi:hypothetical protein